MAISPEQARRQFPHDFASDSVYEVMAEAVNAGEAEFRLINNNLIYHDKFYSDTNYPVCQFRYNSETGLHHVEE